MPLQEKPAQDSMQRDRTDSLDTPLRTSATTLNTSRGMSILHHRHMYHDQRLELPHHRYIISWLSLPQCDRSRNELNEQSGQPRDRFFPPYPPHLRPLHIPARPERMVEPTIGGRAGREPIQGLLASGEQGANAEERHCHLGYVLTFSYTMLLSMKRVNISYQTDIQLCGTLSANMVPCRPDKTVSRRNSKILPKG